MSKADPTSPHFSDENATLLWRSGLMHSPSLHLSAEQLNQLLDAARAEGPARRAPARRAPARKGLRAWIGRLLHGEQSTPITEICHFPAAAAVAAAPAPEPESPKPAVSAPLEVDEDLQAKVRALYGVEP